MPLYFSRNKDMFQASTNKTSKSFARTISSTKFKSEQLPMPFLCNNWPKNIGGLINSFWSLSPSYFSFLTSFIGWPSSFKNWRQYWRKRQKLAIYCPRHGWWKNPRCIAWNCLYQQFLWKQACQLSYYPVGSSPFICWCDDIMTSKNSQELPKKAHQGFFWLILAY